MSQTLTKPVLLDETGQDIVEKLDEIKEAVSMGTDFVPVMIKVTTPPAKVSYMAGENLNLAGIVVSLIASNGVQIDVTDQCTFNPANGTTLTSADTSVAISYYWYKDDVTFTTSLAIGVKQLASIAITTPPTVTEYIAGDTLDLTGIVVVATYDDSTFLDVTSRCTFSPIDGATLTMNDTGVTATYSEGGITKTATQAISVEAPIYGVEWDATSTTAWTRTDSAADFTDPVPYYSGMSETPSSPFDNIMPWAGMEKVEDTDAGTLVKIPKFWYKLGTYNDTAGGAFCKLQISPFELDGFSVSPAHADRGDGEGERDYVYVGAYACGSYKSTVNVMPEVNKTRADFRTVIHNLGSDIWQWDYAMRTTIQMLYLVEFANWNSQAKIGEGHLANSISGNNDLANIPYHTGTAGTSRSASAQCQYRWIGNLWGHAAEFVDGIRVNYRNIILITNPSDFSDSSNGDTVGTYDDSSYDEVFLRNLRSSAYSGYEWVLMPYFGSQGSRNTYVCDNAKRASGYGEQIIIASNNFSNDGKTGLFDWRGESTTWKTSMLTARLMKLPANS